MPFVTGMSHDNKRQRFLNLRNGSMAGETWYPRASYRIDVWSRSFEATHPISRFDNINSFTARTESLF